MSSQWKAVETNSKTEMAYECFDVPHASDQSSARARERVYENSQIRLGFAYSCEFVSKRYLVKLEI